MTIAAGARIGPYEITAPLGQGGMGEVYKARDGRLQRDVAIKVLPPLFASDPERMARFEREAQVLDAVNLGDVRVIQRRKLFDGEIAREYDVAPNGDFYTMVQAPEIAYQRQIQIRTRWFEEVERMMRGAK